jgi:3-oxoacyl-[acyl-carrier-protein] synthase III
MTSGIDYDALLKVSGNGRFAGLHRRFLFGSVADHLTDTFGTKGSPISLSTACASGATAIQLGVEAIRRGETDAALCVATDGSVNAEALIRFSPLSALSTNNDAPHAAARPFSKNRDGFVMAEGAGALVLESLDPQRARRENSRRPRWMRRTCRLVPSHTVKPGRKADRRLREKRAVGRGHGYRADRPHQRTRHQHTGKRQDGVSWHFHRIR